VGEEWSDEGVEENLPVFDAAAIPCQAGISIIVVVMIITMNYNYIRNTQ
jgi:hypothetical protein